MKKLLESLHAKPPKMILYNPGDKYNTAWDRLVLEEVKKNYILRKTILPFEIYEEKS